MNSHLKLIAFLLVFTFFSCKKDNTFTEYKFADNGIVLTCDNVNSKLYSEALFSFEKDILDFYGKSRPNSSQIQAYSQFIRTAIGGRTKYEDIVSAHTIKVFEALKNETNLWDANNQKSHLNYNSPLIKCISNNIKNKDLKITLNSLLTTNSMSSRLFGSPLLSNYRNIASDKYLATYVAFDLFYAKLFDIDLTTIDFVKTETKVDFNKIPEK